MDEVVSRLFKGSIQSIPFASMVPSLLVLEQQSSAEEKISKNGIQKTVHVVIKNSPFHVKIGASNGVGKLDFNHIAFEASLVYDCDGEKEVDYVMAKPMEFKSTPVDDGRCLDAEIRLKVLSSQHEDMLFKVKIQGFHPVTREVINGFSVTTAPIKVISKPEQLKKKAPSKKRSANDTLTDAVQRIERKQLEQQELIERLVEQQVLKLEKKRKIDTESSSTPSEKKAPAQEFEAAFGTLIKAYNQMTAEEKPEAIRNIIRVSSARDTERIRELFDLFWTEGLQKDLGDSFAHRPSFGKTDGCGCVECPHKQELERIDDFYREFLSSGMSSSQMPAYPTNFTTF